MGAAGRARVEAEYTLEQQADALEQAVRGRGARPRLALQRRTRGVRVAGDEPDAGVSASPRSSPAIPDQSAGGVGHVTGVHGRHDTVDGVRVGV